MSAGRDAVEVGRVGVVGGGDAGDVGAVGALKGEERDGGTGEGGGWLMRIE